MDRAHRRTTAEYNEGLRAFLDGVSADECRYPMSLSEGLDPYDERRLNWMLGWVAARTRANLGALLDRWGVS